MTTRSLPTRMNGKRRLDSVMKDLAAKCRTHFTEHRRQREKELNGRATWRSSPHWDGGVWKGTPRPNIWMRGARLAVINTLDISYFVAFIANRHHRLPEPNWLCSPKLIAEFLEEQQYERPNPRQVLRSTLGHQLKLLKRAELREMREFPDPGWTITDARRLILAEDTLGLSALFRHSMAVRFDITDLANLLFLDAFVEYFPHAAVYDQVWENVVPQQMPKFLEALLAELNKQLRQQETPQ